MESTHTLRSFFLVASAALLAACATTVSELATPAAVPPGAARSSSGLDFEYYRTRIEPIFLKARAPNEGAGQACASCHTRVATRLSLQPLTPGATAWTEEQSRQNLQFVSTLVTPGDPLNSRLLLHPLAADAGGDPSHTGGKFWPSQDHPEWTTIAEWVRGAAGPGGTPATAVASAPVPELDYEYFRTRVQAVFLKKRPGLARCYSCHGQGAGEGPARRTMPLEPLSPGRPPGTRNSRGATSTWSARRWFPALHMPVDYSSIRCDLRQAATWTTWEGLTSSRRTTPIGRSSLHGSLAASR